MVFWFEPRPCMFRVLVDGQNHGGPKAILEKYDNNNLKHTTVSRKSYMKDKYCNNIMNEFVHLWFNEQAFLKSTKPLTHERSISKK